MKTPVDRLGMLIAAVLGWGLPACDSVGKTELRKQPAKEETMMPRPDKIVLAEEEWRRKLTPEQFHVCREKGTERAFTGKYWNAKEKGTYNCSACGNSLFSSETKFDSGTGWPSFWQPIAPGRVELEDDSSFLMRRTEVVCARCGSHLGHVFDDGPEPTGQRYCINSVSLELAETPGGMPAANCDVPAGR